MVKPANKAVHCMQGALKKKETFVMASSEKKTQKKNNKSDKSRKRALNKNCLGDGLTWDKDFIKTHLIKA